MKNASKTQAAVKMMQPSKKDGAIADHLRDVLTELGENPTREGLVRTPERYEESDALSDERIFHEARTTS